MKIPKEWVTSIRLLAEKEGILVREVEAHAYAGVTLFTLDPEKYINCFLTKFESTRGEMVLLERVKAAIRKFKETT